MRNQDIFHQAQSWVNLYDKLKPFEDGSLIDITETLKKKMTVLDMFKKSDQFYTDLGLEINDMSYNESLGAVINKPTDRTITCHASVSEKFFGTEIKLLKWVVIYGNLFDD
jgi:peptidyl-dipeptidase A